MCLLPWYDNSPGPARVEPLRILHDRRWNTTRPGLSSRAVAAAWPRVLTWRAMIRMRTDVPVPSVVRGTPSPALPAPAEVLDKLELW